MLCKRVCGPRTVPLAFQLPGGSKVADPAVDIETSDFKRWRDSLFTDADAIKYKPGERPVMWTLQPLMRPQKDAADFGVPRIGMAWWLRCAIKDVSGFNRVFDDGHAEPVTVTFVELGKPIGKVATDDFIDALDLEDQYLTALFLMAKTISEASDPLPASSGMPAGQAKSSETATQPA